MSDDEFDLLDELYFLQSFQFLKEELNWNDARLLTNLQKLSENGWIKCYSAPDQEVFEAPDILLKGKDYLYLATKKGLLKHNLR
ncbi:MAG: hypothetical protein WDZ72_10285 [Cyclobacteriaceae bacterium]